MSETHRVIFEREAEREYERHGGTESRCAAAKHTRISLYPCENACAYGDAWIARTLPVDFAEFAEIFEGAGWPSEAAATLTTHLLKGRGEWASDVVKAAEKFHEELQKKG